MEQKKVNFLCFFLKFKAPLGKKGLNDREGKKLLVLINPKSGSGNAETIFTNISYIFDIANVPYTKICK